MAKKNNKKTIHHILIMDASGSMKSITDVTIRGVNSQIEGILAEDSDKVNQLVSIIRFNTQVYKDFIDVAPKNLPKVTSETYAPDGSTALYDAVGLIVNEYKTKLKNALDTKVFINIFTDGEENASTEYTKEQIALLLHQVQTDLGWVVTYVGANQDVSSVAKGLNIPLGNAMSYSADHVGTLLAFQTMSSSRMQYTRSVGEGHAINTCAMYSSTGQPLDLTFPDKTKLLTEDIYDKSLPTE